MNDFKTQNIPPAFRFLLAIALIPMFSTNTFSQLHTKVYLSPRLCVGWTFYSGFNYGIDFTIGLFNLKSKDPEINFCISPQYYIVNNNHKEQHIISFAFAAESDYYRLGLGMGQVRTKWGFRGINNNKAFGYHFDFALSSDSRYTPWARCKVFALHNGYWEFYGRPYYLSTDIYLRPDPYLVYENN